MEYKCQYCQKIFSQKSNLNTHLKTAKKCILNRNLSQENIINFNCDYCNKNFTQKINLNIHLNNCNQYKIFLKVKEYENMLTEKDKTIQDLLIKYEETSANYFKKTNELKKYYEIQILELKENIKKLENVNKELILKLIEK